MRTQVLQDVEAWVYAPDDLLVQKLRWYTLSNSERQFRDCLNLLATDMKRTASMIDWNYVAGWVGQLGPDVEVGWERVKSAMQQMQA